MKNQTNNSTAAHSQTSKLDGVRLSPHFKLNEFIKADKYPVCRKFTTEKQINFVEVNSM